ncbi:hypothetical protein [Rheinheimera sp.]|uniref:hypothetical protein n=1 Tax=Rheinheimera sp. TaxID=1869214 RepID=UPI0040479D03
MSEINCPHCHGVVSHGAKVCRGCQAEVEYGAPPFLYGVLLILSILFGFKAASFLPEFFGWLTAIVCFVAGAVVLNKFFKDRIKFKRLYRTK